VLVLHSAKFQYQDTDRVQGPTHTAVTPLDLVKCRRQVDPKMYKGNFEAWGKIGRAEGFRGIMTGWGPTFAGYSVRSYLVYLRVATLTAFRPKELSSTAVTSSSNISIPRWSERNPPTSIERFCI
jgi:hypothetical protein